MKLNQTLIDFGMTVWKKKEEFKAKLMVLRKGTLPLQPRQRSSRILSLRRRKKRSHKVQLDASKLECFNCHKMGHFSKDCRQPKRRFKRRFQASTTEEEEPKKKKSAKSSKEEESRRDYYLISALSGSITNSANSG